MTHVKLELLKLQKYYASRKYERNIEYGLSQGIKPTLILLGIGALGIMMPSST